MNASTAEATRFELTLAPSMEIVSSVRVFVSALFDKQFGAPDASAKIQVATHELLENAVKGSSKGPVKLLVVFERKGALCNVEIRTWNQASGWNIACLQRAVKNSKEAKNPAEHFLQLMKETSTRKDGSGLGIGRINSEAGLRIECEVNGDLVCVLATGRIPVEDRS